MSYEEMAAKLRIALDHYKVSIEHLSAEEKDDFLRVAGHAEQVVSALQFGDIDGVKMGIYAFSRQVSDSYFVQPSPFKELSKEISEVGRLLVPR